MQKSTQSRAETTRWTPKSPNMVPKCSQAVLQLTQDVTKGVQSGPQRSARKPQKLANSTPVQRIEEAKKCNQSVSKCFPNEPQGVAKTPRRTPQGSPRSSQGIPKTPKRLARTPPETPRSSQMRRLCSGFRGHEMVPKCTQRVQRGAKMAPRGRQGAPEAPQELSK